MISIIVCSAKESVFKKLEKNIAQTLQNIVFEIIVINNSDAKMGICSAYNKGAKQAKYPYLCFVHEDVEFISTGWGEKIIDFFKNNSNVGIAGLAGSKYKSKYVTGWGNGNVLLERTHLFHRFSDGRVMDFTNNPENETAAKVTVLDGVFLFMPLAVWQQFPFNEAIDGFHFYDIDISLRITGGGYDAVVLYFVDLIHFSGGGFNTSWLRSGFTFHRRKDIQVLIQNQELQKPYETLDKQMRQFWSQRLTNESIDIQERLKLLVYDYKMPIAFIKAFLRFLKSKLAL